MRDSSIRISRFVGELIKRGYAGSCIENDFRQQLGTKADRGNRCRTMVLKAHSRMYVK